MAKRETEQHKRSTKRISNMNYRTRITIRKGRQPVRYRDLSDEERREYHRQYCRLRYLEAKKRQAAAAREAQPQAPA